MASAEEQNKPSWQSDPFGRHEQRWWDGSSWSEKVRSAGTTGIDPPGVDANPEHAHPHVPAPPIVDAAQPVAFGSQSLPWALVFGVLVLVVIVTIVVLSAAG